MAVVKDGIRRVAVDHALALIAQDTRQRVRLGAGAEVLVKPNLVSHKDQRASTHAMTFGASLDALFAAGASTVVTAEGASDATAGFRNFKLDRQILGRSVHFFDLNRDEHDWLPLELTGVDGKKRVARVSRTVVEAPCRVSLALAKTHVTSILTLSLKNMLSSIHPSDRVMMHGFSGGGNGYAGWRKWVVEFLKQDNLAVNGLTRSMGRIKNARNAWKEFLTKGDAFTALTPSELGYLRSVEAMNRNLVALARVTKPHISIVDGFLAMHREGPRHGTSIPLGTIIAGTDAVAVDAVAAAVMGFDPRSIGYLAYADAAGLGTIDLDRITVVGDAINDVRHPCVPHSNYHVQRHWPRLSGHILSAPHFSMAESAVRR